MLLKMPIPVSFYKGWKELRVLKIIKIGELCGLIFTGDFNENDEPEFIGNNSCWSNFKKQVSLI